jgi:CHAT domain-containing protein
MNYSIERKTQLETWLAEDISPDLLSIPLHDDAASEMVDALKREADRYWSIDPNISVRYADRIIAIGRARNDRSQEALGLMARGDALKFLGRLQEAWDVLEQSGNLFQLAGDEVGWARTRIGRLFLGPDLNRVSEVFADVERARQIFEMYGEQEKLLRLEMNTAYIHALLGDQHQALNLYQSALAVAERLGEAGAQHLGMIHMNIGYVYESFGNFPQALLYYEKARSHYLVRQETRNLFNVDKNIACIALAQGHYRSALNRLNAMIKEGVGQFPREEAGVKQSLAECYLNLNRYGEARDLSQQVLAGYRSFNDSYNSARELLHLASAEVELRNFSSAESALDEAALVFTSLGSPTWGTIAELWHGQLAFKQGDLELAWQKAHAAADRFDALDQQVNYAMACLLIGQVALARGDFESANWRATHALRIAQHFNVPSIRYDAHLLLGRIAKANSRTVRAIWHFRAATATIDRVQRGLTITLRSGFMENKGEAWQELIGLYLSLGQTAQAFDALEQAKSQVLINYLANREQFRWSREDPESQSLIDELERLRAEHRVYYHVAFNPPREQDAPSVTVSEDAQEELVKREKRMRAITERLYLLSHSDGSGGLSSGSFLPAIQAGLDAGTVLVEFYEDGRQFWAFVIDDQSCRVQPLSIKVEVVKQLLHQLKTNISAALSLEPNSLALTPLTLLAKRLLQRLYTLLLEPLKIKQGDYERIIFVPYSVLHYLPFHLLFDGSRYLIETSEVINLPAASLLTRETPHRSPGARILAHSWNGRLPYTLTEAQVVQSIVGGVLHKEENASRLALEAEPSQILHIATHGQHRPDQPDLSFLELADGQLYADDLLQHDMSYELVTLSACETGQSNVAADEELIGIGRGLLYAGAGALILSLWQVADFSTVSLMEQLYRSLQSGRSKSASLREAQASVLAEQPDLHPAFWGAFQLIGDARPLFGN